MMDLVVGVLSDLALDRGFSTSVLWMPPDPEALRVFIAEVAPAERGRVAAERSSRVSPAP
jgi:hypothetical protein